MTRAPASSDGVARRRKVLVLTGLGLLPLVARLVVLLSSHTVTRMKDVCVSKPFATDPNSTAVFSIPCHPGTVTIVASWRWPVLIAALLLTVIGIATVWLMMPRLPVAEPPVGPVEPLAGRAHGAGTRYRLSVALRWLMYLLGAPFLVGGLLLLLLPSGAPPVISIMFSAIGILCTYGAGAGTIDAMPDELRVRTLVRRRRWPWAEISHITCVDAFFGRGMKARAITILTTDGGSFTDQSLSSGQPLGEASRADRIAAALEHTRRDVQRTRLLR